MPDEHQAVAHAFAKEICRGNKDAEVFCSLFYDYCHGIDTLIDAKEDDRPRASNEQIIALFINAALLYNCRFFRDNQDLLLSSIITVTNQWADSVKWERDPKEHRRVMADCLRTCGDEVFNMVAFITGGWHHVRSVSPRIRETDYIKQHQKPDDFF